jgi:hypothetical protein
MLIGIPKNILVGRSNTSTARAMQNSQTLVEQGKAVKNLSRAVI